MDEMRKGVVDWMRFFTPEVERQIQNGNQDFVRIRDAYEALRMSPENEGVIRAAQEAIDAVSGFLDEMMQQGSLDYLAQL